MPGLGGMGESPEMLDAMMSMMMGGMGGGGSGIYSRYEDLNKLRRTEQRDTKNFLKYIRKACVHLDLENAEESCIVDLGSGCGYIAAQYQHEFPNSTVISSDVTYPEPLDAQAKHPSMALLNNTLRRLLEDHENRVARIKAKMKLGLWQRPRGSRRLSAAGRRKIRKNMQRNRINHETFVKTYTKMIEHTCEIDVLAPLPWTNVAHLEGKCKLVTATMILHQKAFETPEMWKNILLGAAGLLAPGGVLLMHDGNRKNGGKDFEDLSDKEAVSKFAQKCNLQLKTHQVKEHGVVCLIVLEKIIAESNTQASKELASGDLVEVHGLIGKKEHNGCSGILDVFNTEKGRWSVKVNTGVTAKRTVSGMLVKPENLRQLMPLASAVPTDAASVSTAVVE